MVAIQAKTATALGMEMTMLAAPAFVDHPLVIARDGEEARHAVIVQPDGTLGRGAWPDGAAHCETPEHVFRRHTRFEWWTAAIATVLILTAVIVTFGPG